LYESYAITAGELPEGLTLDAATGAITGTAAAKGEYTISVIFGYMPARRASMLNPVDALAQE
ncbi:MAG: putative Ig domain-containing protein, partial [Mailhella sp.]|nr:putative Ig domain-containing protein [Mailhella sp.]